MIAATVRTSVNDISAFKSGRDFAAWMGLTPRLLSSGGKEKLGSTAKQGNRQLRTLLVVGASSILKQAKRGAKLSEWLVGLMARKPYKLVAVALASKMARMIWALLSKRGIYRRSAQIFAAIDTIACQREDCSGAWFNTSRTARSRTSGENLFVVLLLIAPSSQELGPPVKRARFTATPCSGLLLAYSYAKQLEALRFKTPLEALKLISAEKPELFVRKPSHHMRGLNN